MLPLVQTGLAWLRRELAWSNSRQSWEERLSVVFLLGIGLCIGWLHSWLSVPRQLLLWALWGVAAAVLLRRGWIRLLGPMLFYDLIRIARRTRYILLRTLYALLLAALLGWVYLLWYEQGTSGEVGTREMAAFAESFFDTFMCVQFTVVVLLTPAYSAGAIAEEKERKTLEFLLATDLRNREIILSKLLSRLANVLLLVLAGLPILSFLQFLGGVDPNLVMAGFAATGLTALSLAGLSIFNSVLSRRPRNAIALTYLGGAGYLVLSGASWLLLLIPGLTSSTTLLPESLNSVLPEWLSALTLGDLLDGFNSGNIVAQVVQLQLAVDASKNLANVLPAMVRNYAIFHGLLAILTCGWAIVRLRTVALKETHGKAQRLPLATRLFGRPRIGSNPMLWKELFVEPGLRLNLFARVVVIGLILVSFVPLWFIAMELPNAADLGRAMNFWVRLVGAAVACLLLLAVAGRACNSISGERDRQTFDALLASPLRSQDILLAKWLGNVTCVRWGWLWLGVIYFLGLVTGGLHPLAVPLLLGAWLVYALVVSGIGVWFSLVNRTTLRATLWTLLTTAAAGVGHWLIWACCGPLLYAMHEPPPNVEMLIRLQVGITPPAALGYAFSFCWADFDASWGWGAKEQATAIWFGLIGLMFWAGIAFALWVVTSTRFETAGGRTLFRRGQPLDPEVQPTSAAGVLEGTQTVAVEPFPLPEAQAMPDAPPRPRGAVLIDEEWQPDEPERPPA
jgi:ABC-type transport system involved in multi-copper enzyme maturation permease subunit